MPKVTLTFDWPMRAQLTIFLVLQAKTYHFSLTLCSVHGYFLKKRRTILHLTPNGTHNTYFSLKSICLLSSSLFIHVPINHFSRIPYCFQLYISWSYHYAFFFSKQIKLIPFPFCFKYPWVPSKKNDKGKFVFIYFMPNVDFSIYQKPLFLFFYIITKENDKSLPNF